MKKLLFILVFLPALVFSQNNFENFFLNGSLRVDLLLAGNYQTTKVYLQVLKREPFWGGSKKNLIDTLKYGSYLTQVNLAANGKLIYSRGFCTLFQEWQTTEEAHKIEKAFFQSVTFPFPKDSVKLEIFERARTGRFNRIFSISINPADYFIQPFTANNYNIVKVQISGDPSRNVDIVFLPEGYTKDEMSKFISDVRKLSDTLFTISPFKKFRNSFNLYAILAPSEESGTDIPGKGIWRNTQLNSSFYTFNSERYLTTYDYLKVRDLAANVPYDQICILVNSAKYGGGGIYNHYSLTSVDNELSPFTFIHEFGHGFGALADEYYTSDVSYDNFYPLDIEPWEPNLTTLVNFKSKWENLLTPGTPVPTPDSSSYRDGIGVFEGGGYMAYGIYRPQIDCIMKSRKPRSFCTVCEISIEKMIHWLTD